MRPYANVNTRLVEVLALTGGEQVCELGSGPAGTVTVQLWERLADHPASQLWAVDHNAEALATLRAQWPGPLPAGLTLVHGDACDLPRLLPGPVDVVVATNMVHEVRDKGRLLAAVGRCLRPGGRFALHTAFVAEHLPACARGAPGVWSLGQYRAWLERGGWSLLHWELLFAEPALQAALATALVRGGPSYAGAMRWLIAVAPR